MKFTKQLRIAVFCGLTLWRTDPGAAAGGVIELINNDGVVKEGRSPAVIHPEVVAHVRLTPRFAWKRGVEWVTGIPTNPGPTVNVDIPPGESRYVEFHLAP